MVGLPCTDSSGADCAAFAGRITAALVITDELEDCELKARISWELGFETDARRFPRFRLLDKCSNPI